MRRVAKSNGCVHPTGAQSHPRWTYRQVNCMANPTQPGHGSTGWMTEWLINTLFRYASSYICKDDDDGVAVPLRRFGCPVIVALWPGIWRCLHRVSLPKV